MGRHLLTIELTNGGEGRAKTYRIGRARLIRILIGPQIDHK